MSVPTYLLEKLARHGAAAIRLREERAKGDGEFHEMSETTAIAFDAADFVWAFLCLEGYSQAQQSRQIRNSLAEALLPILEELVREGRQEGS